jgi:hypothetical protein
MFKSQINMKRKYNKTNKTCNPKKWARNIKKKKRNLKEKTGSNKNS